MNNNEKLFLDNYDKLLKYTKKMNKSTDTSFAESLLHETYLSIKETDVNIVAMSYIYNTIRNKSIISKRSLDYKLTSYYGAVIPEIDSDRYTYHEHKDYETKLHLIRQAIKDLPKKQGEVITNLINGKDNTDSNYNTWKINRRLAIIKLRELLKEDIYET